MSDTPTHGPSFTLQQLDYILNQLCRTDYDPEGAESDDDDDDDDDDLDDDGDDLSGCDASEGETVGCARSRLLTSLTGIP